MHCLKSMPSFKSKINHAIVFMNNNLSKVISLLFCAFTAGMVVLCDITYGRDTMECPGQSLLGTCLLLFIMAAYASLEKVLRSVAPDGSRSTTSITRPGGAHAQPLPSFVIEEEDDIISSGSAIDGEPLPPDPSSRIRIVREPRYTEIAIWRHVYGTAVGCFFFVHSLHAGTSATFACSTLALVLLSLIEFIVLDGKSLRRDGLLKALKGSPYTLAGKPLFIACTLALAVVALCTHASRLMLFEDAYQIFLFISSIASPLLLYISCIGNMPISDAVHVSSPMTTVICMLVLSTVVTGDMWVCSVSKVSHSDATRWILIAFTPVCFYTILYIFDWCVKRRVVIQLLPSLVVLMGMLNSDEAYIYMGVFLASAAAIFVW